MSLNDLVSPTFAVEHQSFGKITKFDLKDDGESITVTEDNKKEFVQYVCLFFILNVQWVAKIQNGVWIPISYLVFLSLFILFRKRFMC